MIKIASLTMPEHMLLVEDLQRRVWPGSELDVVPGHLLITIEHNGGVLLGAFDGQRLVGFVLGFLGVDSDTPDRVAMARLKHCSHMLGVDPEYRDQGIGVQLKLAQRRLVIEQGIRLITWTYDPLLSRNAHINIRRLGGVCHRYLPDAYGEMRDDRNRGGASDRFEVEWWLSSTRVETRIEGRRKPVDLANILAAGVVKVNPATLGADDLPRPAEALEPMEGNLLLVEIPPDFDLIKQTDRELAVAWRQQTRAIFQDAFRAGYLVSDFVHLDQEAFPRSYYLLVHGEGTLG
jgi:predicted GNAT superfamily acetyltransferase